MKTRTPVIHHLVLALLILCLGTPEANSQDQAAGSWEGKFMGDFRTVIELRSPQENRLEGKILMFSGENIIQDDPISSVRIDNGNLTFRIEAKETGFEGSFNKDYSELSGHFIFPDGSRHPLLVRKAGNSEGAAPDSPESYLELKQNLYPVEGLTADLMFLMENLQAYHPRLHRYCTEQMMIDGQDHVLKSLNSGLTLEDYYRLLAPLTEMIRCSHTGIRLPEHYMQLLQAHGNFMPLNLLFLNGPDGYSAWCASPGTGVPAGSEVMRINGVPIHQIVVEMLAFIPSEGDCMTAKFHELNRNFHTYFNLVDGSGSFEVEFLTPSSGGTAVLQARRFNELAPVPGIPAPGEPWGFYTDETTAMATLRVSSFEIGDINGFIMDMDRVFRRLEQERIPNLILDLRGNPGGHPIFAAQLFSYLTDHEFTYFNRNPEVEAFEPLYGLMQPSPFHYHGNLYALVNGGCLSTTGHLISLLKYHTGAIFIGEEPGSSFSCNDFSLRITLPNTGIQVNIPRTTFETAVSGFTPGAPFPVDLRVETTVDDVIQGRDSYLAAVCNLLSGGYANP